MPKYARVYVQPHDAVDCNQLRSLFDGCEVSYLEPMRVGCLVNVILNLGKPSIYVGFEDKLIDTDPIVSVNELANQIKLWQLN